jgi:hypothetical protein
VRTVPNPVSYSDDELAATIADSRSWRGVLRCLGKKSTSAGSFRAARRRADKLRLDYSHFTGQRTWSDSALTEAIAVSRSWNEVTTRLGLSSSSRSLSAVRTRATRLRIDSEHLNPQPGSGDPPPFPIGARLEHLRSAGPLLGAAWFVLRGHEVTWPLEPCRYDFVVRANGAFHRVQVKTTTYKVGASSVASVSTTRRGGRMIYGADEVDQFFIIDADLNAYLIPIDVVFGYQQINVERYRAYRVAERGQWLSPRAADDGAG